VILDPPSYGHGDRPWRIAEDLEPLLDDLAGVLGPRPAFAVLAAHTPGFDGDRLAALLREHLGVAATAGEGRLIATSGNVLGLGAWARSPGR
jgi:hypothetical protein